MISARLIAITDTSVAPLGSLEARIGALLERAAPGSVLVQLRDHELDVSARFELGRRLQTFGAQLIVNDRIDLALALGAEGVHLGERSVSVEDARRLLSERVVFRARHDLLALERESADAVVLAPVLAARHGRPPLGLTELERARACLPARARLYALGGIDASNARECLAAGADGIAAIGAVLDGRDVQPLPEALEIAR